jgi:hypothetical protein
MGINFCRNRPGEPHLEYTSWSGFFSGAFRAPKSFGTLTFGE